MRSRFQFVDDHRDTYEVKRLCHVLDVNRSSYYKWLAGREARAARRRDDRLLPERIREVHRESAGAYGSPRVSCLNESSRRSSSQRMANGAASKAGLNRSILDAGWGVFLGILAQKAESAARVLIPVDPRNTSRTCPECRHIDHADRVGAWNVALRAGLVLPDVA